MNNVALNDSNNSNNNNNKYLTLDRMSARHAF